MATYKVIQDIESEDKLLGPLTLRQFIYAAIVVVSGFIAFKIIMTGAWYLVIPLLPHMIFFSVLAAPFGHDQSSEVWLLARIRFMLKPRRRIWDQSGLQELVTITVPKKIEQHLTNGLNQTEVKSRLEALANTIDSRGWAVKNVNVNMYALPSYASAGSDRLLNPSAMPTEVPAYDTYAADDMLDPLNNPTAQHLDQMINTSEQQHRQQLMATMQQATQPQPGGPPPNYWFMNDTPQPTQPGQAAFAPAPVVAPGTPVVQAPTSNPTDEQALLDKIHRSKQRPDPSHTHMKTIDPEGHKKPQQPQPSRQPEMEQPAMTRASNPAILELANNDDLNVATLARQAEKATKQEPKDEVVISLR